MTFNEATAHQIAMANGRETPNAKDTAAALAAVERFTTRRALLGLAPFTDADAPIVSSMVVEIAVGDE
jgi:hypothetical protein